MCCKKLGIVIIFKRKYKCAPLLQIFDIDLLENGALYQKISFYIFNSFFRADSRIFNLHHPVY